MLALWFILVILIHSQYYDTLYTHYILYTLYVYTCTIGKFEQEIWVNNLNDHFDQKRIVITATVTIPQSLLVKFPGLVVCILLR